jgi:hypothetical protein
MDKQHFDRANATDRIDEYTFSFWDTEHLLARNIKTKDFKIVRSDNNGMHVTVRGFIKKNLSVFVTPDGFLNVEGMFTPGGKHALVFADGEYSVRTPSSVQMSQQLDCLQMIIAIPAATEGVAAWIEAESLKFLTTLRSFHFWGLRSPDPIIITNVIDCILLVEDNNIYNVEHASGVVDVSVYSDAAISTSLRPYSIVRIGKKAERIGVLTLRMPGEGEVYIDCDVTILQGLLAGVVDVVQPAVNTLKMFHTARYYTHP